MNTNINASRKINIDFENLLALYKHYKEFLLPVGVILASTLVIIYVVFPQIQQYFNSQDLIKAEQQKLDALRNSYIGYIDPVTLISNNKLKLNRNSDDYYRQHLVLLKEKSKVYHLL